MPINFDGKKGDFSACVANSISKGKTPEQARKICGGIQKRQEKESKYCSFGKIQIKEDEKNYHVSGFVATSHPDRAEADGFAGDIIPKGTLQRIVTDINNKDKPQAGAVSERHDYIVEQDMDLPLAGVTVEDATLVELEDGEWGVHVDTVLSKTNPRYEEIKTNIEQGVYPGFSIEYITNDFVPVEREGKTFRLLTDIGTEGFGFANRRLIANPRAEITSHGYKEIATINIKKQKGEKKMSEKENKEKAQKIIDELKGKERKEIEAKLVEADIPDAMIKELLPVEGEDTPPADPPATPPTEPTSDPKPSEKEYTVSKEDMAILAKFKEEKERSKIIKEVEPVIHDKVKKEMELVMKEKSPLFNTEEDGKVKFKEFDDYQASLRETKELDKPVERVEHRHSTWKRLVDRQFKEAAKLYDALASKGVNPFKNSQFAGPAEGKDNKFEMFDSRIEMKEFDKIEIKAGEGAQVDTNLADASCPDHLISSAHLSPIPPGDIANL